MPLALVRKALAALFVIALLLGAAHAQGVLPVPALTGHVIDQTATLSAGQAAALEGDLVALEREKGTQVVVLIVPSTAPEDIFSYANRVGNTWKIGRRDVGDGLLIIVAKDDRRVRIEVAKTLEGAVPDLAAKGIIDDVITPAFRRGDYAAGLSGAVAQIAARVRGEPLPPVQASRRAQKNAGSTGDLFDVIVLVAFFVPVAGALLRGIFGRKLGAIVLGAGAGAGVFWLGQGIALAVIVALGVFVFALLGGAIGPGLPRGGGWGGGGYGGGGFGSGGGGGGFSSGGGGSFGGGGASGSW